MSGNRKKIADGKITRYPGLKVLNDWPTFPQIIVKGELIGGLDLLKELVDNGEFKEMIS